MEVVKEGHSKRFFDALKDYNKARVMYITFLDLLRYSHGGRFNC